MRDLELAASIGFLVLPVEGADVSIERGVLRYDPSMPHERRAAATIAALEKWAKTVRLRADKRFQELVGTEC